MQTTLEIEILANSFLPSELIAEFQSQLWLILLVQMFLEHEWKYQIHCWWNSLFDLISPIQYLKSYIRFTIILASVSFTFQIRLDYYFLILKFQFLKS